MGDVCCNKCGEPWDTYHLRHDAIWEAIYDGGLWPDIAAANLKADRRDMLNTRWKGVLTPEIRAAFAQVGYAFGDTVYAVLHCPSCKCHGHDDRPVARTPEQIALESLMPGDQDGVCCELEDRYASDVAHGRAGIKPGPAYPVNDYAKP